MLPPLPLSLCNIFYYYSQNSYLLNNLLDSLASIDFLATILESQDHVNFYLPSTFYLKGEISSIWIMLGFEPAPHEGSALSIAAWSLGILMKYD